MRYLFLLLILTSCNSAVWHLKQAEKLGSRVTTDTVYQDVRVFVPKVQKDTVFSSMPGDTVTITKDRLQVKYVKLAGERVYIEGACLPDTVKISVPVEVTRTIEAGYSGWDVAKVALFTAVIVALLAVFYFGFLKR